MDRAKILATFVLVIALAVTLLPMTVSAAVGDEFVDDGIKYKVLSEDDDTGTVEVIANNYSYSGDITVPETVENGDITYTVISIGEDAFRFCGELTSIEIPDGVTSIERGAFADCTGLESISLPESVTTIGNEAFYNCSSLASVTILGNVTTIESSAFQNCTGLGSISLPDSVTSIGVSAFQGCTGLTGIDLPESLETIGENAFRGCTGLTGIDLPESLETIGVSAFRDCSSLESIILPDSLGTIGQHAFRDCSSLASVTIGGNVTTIGNHAFYNCTGLTSINLDGVTTIEDYAFQGCRLLESIGNLDNVTFIGNYAFQNCSSLESIGNLDNVTTIGTGAFYDCSLLTSVTINGNVTSIENLTFSGCGSLASVDLPAGLLTIGVNAFFSCENLESIDLPNSLLTIGVGAFQYCTGLTGIDIPENVTTIENVAFQGCTGLTGTITIPERVTSISTGVFMGCSGLESIILPDSLETIGDQAFQDCSSLTGIIIPESVTSISGSAFAGCTGLTGIIIPESVTSIGGSAFFGCTGLTSVVFHRNEPPSFGGSVFVGAAEGMQVYVPGSAAGDYQTALSGKLPTGAGIIGIIDDGSIPGVTAPIAGWPPVEEITGEQYTGTVNWAPAPEGGKFVAGEDYTATITLTAQPGYTFDDGLAADFFTVAGADPVTCEYDAEEGSYVVTAEFPEAVMPVMSGTVTIGGVAKFNEVLTANTSNITYDPEPYDNEFKYQWKRNGADIDEATASTYTLVQADIGQTISVTVTADDVHAEGSVTSAATAAVEKADAATPAAPARASKTRSSVTLVANAAHEFRVDGGIWQDSNVFEDLAEGTEYTFTARVKETETHKESAESPGRTVTTDTKITIAAIPGVTAPARGATPVTEITETDQYTGTVSWEPEDDKFAAGKTYTATIMLTARADHTFDGVAANFFTVAGAASVTYGCSEGYSGVVTAVFPATDTPEMGGSVTISGVAKFDQTLTADISGITYTYDEEPVTVGDDVPTYQWKRNGADIGGATASTYRLVQADIGQTISVTVTADGVHAEGSVTSAATAAVEKADGPAAPAAPALESKTHNSVTLVANAAHEFRVDEGEWQDSPVFTGLSPLTTYTFTARVKETDTHEESDASAGLEVTTDTAVVDMAAIQGVTRPARGATPVTAITETVQYTGTVSWAPAPEGGKFAASTVYTATITLTAKTGYTLEGVEADFFEVAGADSVTNEANSGVIEAVFPDTGRASSGGGGSSRTTPAANIVGNIIVIETISMDKQTETTSTGQRMETFTVQDAASDQIEAAKGKDRTTVQFKVDSSRTSITNVNVPSTVLQSVADMNVLITTPNATLELPADLVNALVKAGQGLALTVTRSGEVANPADTTVLGTPITINTDIVGTTQVTIPLTGVTMPADPQEREAFLASLAVFAIHSDGERQIINGEVVYDANGKPTGITFPVDKFSTFAIVKLSKKTVTLTIEQKTAAINGIPYNLDASPFVDTSANRTLAPLRFIGEALGAKVEWLAETRQVRIKDGTKEISLTLDSTDVLIDGVKTQTDCAPVIVPPGRTFLPLRFISEALGAEVVYDDETKQITIIRDYGID